ncbi:MAG: regulatory protein [Humibacillus sp.]|nr:regulatory protein [Humibacillus sp.]
MSPSDGPESGPPRPVSSPGLDREGIETVARFMSEGWARSERALAVTTAGHLRRLDAALRRLGHDPDALRRDTRYTCVEADAMIQQASTTGGFDPERFGALAVDLVRRAGAGSPVRAFGEVVARLWQRGEVQAALEVERQWQGLLRRHDLSILSASAATAFGRSTLLDVRRICDLHTELSSAAAPQAGDAAGEGPQGVAVDEPGHPQFDLPLTVPLDLTALSRRPDHACSRVYLPTRESVPAARHFVVEVLRAWGDDGIVPDAAIVASELATNALLHAGSPFRIVLDRRADRVRIGVEDGARELPSLRAGGSEQLDGRGVALIEALSARWGSTPVLTGKVVWAEVSRVPSSPRAPSLDVG